MRGRFNLFSETGFRPNLHVSDSPFGAARELGRYRHPSQVSAHVVIQQLPRRGQTPSLPLPHRQLPRVLWITEHEGLVPRSRHQRHTLALYLHHSQLLR